MEYIADNIEAIDDSYSQAIATYALQLADHPQKHEALDSLLGKSIAKGSIYVSCIKISLFTSFYSQGGILLE